jgi:transposase
MSTKPLSEETRAEARRLLAEGCTYRSIGQALNVNHSTIQKMVKRDKSAVAPEPMVHAPRQGSKIPMEIREQVIRALEHGMKRPFIVAKFGVSRWAVDNIAEAMPRKDDCECSEDVWTGARKLVAARLLKQRLMMSYIAEKLTIDFPGPAVMAADVVSFQQSLGAR